MQPDHVRHQSAASPWYHDPEFAALLAVVVIVGMPIGAATVILCDDIAAVTAHVMRLESVPFIIVGAVTGLAGYGYATAENKQFRCSTALIRTLTGGVFGSVMSTTAAGLGVNSNLQTTAAAVGGVMGPRAMDTVMTIATGRRNDTV